MQHIWPHKVCILTWSPVPRQNAKIVFVAGYLLTCFSEWIKQLDALIFAVKLSLVWAPPTDKLKNVLAHVRFVADSGLPDS